MKKILFALSTLVIFAVGCSKDDIDTTVTKYDLVVNMDKPSFGDSTRAARTSWENGDVVYIVFNGDVSAGSDVKKYLALTYNGSSWTPTWVGTNAAEVAAKETKTFCAGYINDDVGTINIYSMGFIMFSRTVDNGVCVMTCSDGSYTVEDSTITLNMTLKHDCAQVTVRGLDVADGWTLKSNGLMKLSGFSIDMSNGAGTSNNNYDAYLHGFANADGVSFYGLPDNYESDFTFTLTNGEKTYMRTITGKSLNEGDAIIMNGPSTPGAWEEVTE